MTCCDGVCTGVCGQKPEKLMHVQRDPGKSMLRRGVNVPDKRVPEVLMPKPVVFYVKRALGIPIYAPVRLPMPGGGWKSIIQRIA